MKVHYVHWHEAEAAERADVLRSAGHDVTFSFAEGGAALREIRSAAPDVVVIDLRRLPSHGRELAGAVTTRKDLRGMGLVLIEGEPEKTERARIEFPEVEFAPWSRARSAIKRAARTVGSTPRRAAPSPAGYSGTPLPKKLGIKPGSTACFLGAPDAFGAALGDLPDGVTVRSRAGGAHDVVVLFAKRGADLRKRLPIALKSMGDGGCTWIAWPKKTSSLATDITREDVREVGLAAGVVDVKVCAIDADWSGLQFRRRKG